VYGFFIRIASQDSSGNGAESVQGHVFASVVRVPTMPVRSSVGRVIGHNSAGRTWPAGVCSPSWLSPSGGTGGGVLPPSGRTGWGIDPGLGSHTPVAPQFCDL